MPDILLFDKLAYVDRLTKAGIGEDQARAHAEAMEDALRESVATKSDLTGVRNEMALLRKEIELAVYTMTVRVGGMLAFALGILLAVRFFVR